MKNFMNKTANKINNSLISMQSKAHFAFSNQRGDQNLGSAIQILIAVVIGALLLAGLYTLFDEVVLPTVTERVQEMFDYAG